MSTDPSARMQSVLSRVVQPVLQRQTYLNIIYALLAFPLGLVYFTFLVVGLSLTVGLLVCVPFLLATLGMVWAFSRLDRHVTIWLLNVDIPQAHSERVPHQSLGAQVGSYLRDIQTYKHLAYLLARLPIGILSFTAAVFLIALTFGLLSAPWFYTEPVTQIQLAGWRLDTPQEALLAVLCGVGIALGSLHAINWLAFLQGRFARLMLGSPTSEGATGR